MDSVDVLQTTQKEQKQHTEKDQAVATHDVTDRKQETDGNALVEEVSLVEEEVKISAVVDSVDPVRDAAVSETVEETSSLTVETISESQPLGKVSADELSGLIDLDASKGVADETNEKKAVPPITPVNTNTAVDVGETKDAVVDADAESTTVEPTKTSVFSDTDKVLEEDVKEKESTIAKDKENQEKNKLNDDGMQLEHDVSAEKDDTAAAANEAPDHADASLFTEDMDIDESTTDKKKKKKKEQSAKEPARKEKQGKGKKFTKVQESEDEEEEDEVMEEEYEVENIAGHRIFKGKVVKYIVKWKGYPSSENTIENATTMHDDVPELCAAYWATCKEKKPDNVPQVATEELKPLLEERQPKSESKVKHGAAHDSGDSDDDDTYKPGSKAKLASPVAAIPPPASSKDKAESTPSEEESRARSRRATPAPPSFTTSNASTSTSSDATTPKQSTQSPLSNSNNKRKRAVSSSAPEPSQVKKFKKNMEHVPEYMLKLGYQFPTHWPNKSTEWDVDVKKVCVQASPIDGKVRFTYLEWNNGEKTIHSMKEAHEMIPEKLIHYYEERLQFV